MTDIVQLTIAGSRVPYTGTMIFGQRMKSDTFAVMELEWWAVSSLAIVSIVTSAVAFGGWDSQIENTRHVLEGRHTESAFGIVAVAVVHQAIVASVECGAAEHAAAVLARALVLESSPADLTTVAAREVEDGW